MDTVKPDRMHNRKFSGLQVNEKAIAPHSLIQKAISKGKRLSTRGSQQRLIGTSGNDILEAFRGQGKNFLKGNKGNDKLFAGKGDRLLGDAGFDLLDARKGKGSNVLFGGADNDILYAKTLDSLDGGLGDDQLWALLPGNQRTGGLGADQFWIGQDGLTGATNVIKDFDLAADVIGINNLPPGTRFNDLTLTQQGSDTVVSWQGRAIALLSGINASGLSYRNFVGMQPPIAQPPITQPLIKVQLPTLSIVNDSSISERDSGTTSVGVEVVLNTASSSPIIVDYRTVAGTATPEDNDYTPVNGTVTFAPGETSKTIVLEVVNDTRNEFDETFSLVLSNVTNATFAKSEATITILDNDITVVQGNGLQIQGARVDGLNVSYEFQLYAISPTGTLRVDEDGNLNNNVGIFRGAIEQFKGSIGDGGQFFRFDELEIGTSGTDTLEKQFFPALTFDLQAKYIPANSPITFPNGVTPMFEPFGEEPLKATGNGRIEYTLTNSQLREKAGIFELTLVVDTLTNIDVQKAVNSIDYILANQLLGKIDFIRVTGISENPSEIQARFPGDTIIFQTYEGNIAWVNEEIASYGTSALASTRTVESEVPGSGRESSSIVSSGNEVNDTIATATDTGIRPNGADIFKINGKLGDNPNFSPRLDVDIYKIQLSAGERVTIDIDADELGFTTDTSLRLFNAAGNEFDVIYNEPIAGEISTKDPSYSFKATTSGTYYIAISGNDNTGYDPLTPGSGVAISEIGDYTLEIVVNEPNETIARAIDTQLTSGNSFVLTTQVGDNNGTPALDVDFYKVQLNAGELLEIDIDTDGFTNTNFSKVDSFLRFFDSTGKQLAASDDHPAPNESLSYDSYISYQAVATGTYYVGVSGFNNSTYNPLTGTNGTTGSTGYYTLNLTRSL